MRPVEFSPAVEALLTDAHLPVDDLRGDRTVSLFGYEREGELLGVIGLEPHGTDALLRSLAVAGTERGKGLGAALVSQAERQAMERGVDTLYLLTTSAEGFFARLGYRAADRNAAPASIAATPQFSGLCPASSAFMIKPLDR